MHAERSSGLKWAWSVLNLVAGLGVYAYLVGAVASYKMMLFLVPALACLAWNAIFASKYPRSVFAWIPVLFYAVGVAQVFVWF